MLTTARWCLHFSFMFCMVNSHSVLSLYHICIAFLYYVIYFHISVIIILIWYCILFNFYLYYFPPASIFNPQHGETLKHPHTHTLLFHDDVIKWKHFLRYWPFVRGIHRSLVNSPAQRPVKRSFDVFFDLCLIKWLSKHSRGWWFETLSHPVWRHCNACCNNLCWLLIHSIAH